MRKGKKMVTVLSYVILAAGLLWVSLPFVWMVLTAFKPAKEVLSMPPKWIPSVWQWENFKMALQQVPYARYFFNSVFTAVMVTVGEVFTTVLAAYAFAYSYHSGLKCSVFGSCSDHDGSGRNPDDP